MTSSNELVPLPCRQGKQQFGAQQGQPFQSWEHVLSCLK